MESVAADDEVVGAAPAVGELDLDRTGFLIQRSDGGAEPDRSGELSRGLEQNVVQRRARDGDRRRVIRSGKPRQVQRAEWTTRGVGEDDAVEAERRGDA